MARPLKHPTGPVVSVIDTDGRAAAWCDGITTGNTEIVKNAKEAAERRQDYRLMGAWVTCDDSTPLGAAAALCQLNPGRTFLVEAPAEV
ncbi:MAG TPA: hypothetical protein VF885_07465, partial [Arthrobacter sp.]